MMYYTIIHCFNPTDRKGTIDRIRVSFPSLEVTTKSVNPYGIHLKGEDTDSHDRCSTQYENDTRFGVIYRLGHPKSKENVCFHPTKHGRPMGTPRPSSDTVSPATEASYVPGYPGIDYAYASRMATFYNYPAYNASTSPVRPKIGILSQGGNYLASDLTAYWVANGQTVHPTVTTVPVPPTYIPPAFGGNGDVENALDLDLAGGVCNNAIINFYSSANSTSSYYPVIEQAMSDGMNVLSISWIVSEAELSYSFMQMLNDLMFFAVQIGMVITAATGDNGCFPDVANFFEIYFPSNSPWVVACGGTSLAGTVESVWNNFPSSNPTSHAGGGGQSSVPLINPVPAYQANLVIPDPVYPAPARYVPDIAMNADPNSGWIISLTTGSVHYFYIGEGGTSAVAPFMAGLVAIMYALSTPGSIPNLGYVPGGLNTYMYQAPYSSCFNDITVGSNGSAQTRALVGYDMSSGLGSINGTNLFNYLNTYVCIGKGTKILLSDGSTKEIQDIVPGDKVSGKNDSSNGPCTCDCCTYYKSETCNNPDTREFTVVKVLAQLVSPESILDVLTFEPGCLGNNLPRDNLTITQWHPMFINNMHVYARYFKAFAGIKIYDQAEAKNCLPVSDDGNYYLYDLQFSHEGAYTAEGVVVQSRSPNSTVTPL